MTEPAEEVGRIEAAANALQTEAEIEASALPDTTTDAPAEAAEVADVQPDAEVADESAEASATEEAQADSDSKEAAPEETEASLPEEPPNYKWEELRRKTSRLERDRAELTALREQAEREVLEARKQLEAFNDPDRIVELVAKRQGLTVDQAFERWAQNKLNGMDQPQGRQPTIEEIRAEARKEALDVLRAEHAKAQEAERARIQQANQTQIEQFVQAALNIPYTPKLAEKLPHLASLQDNELAGKVEYAVKWAAKNAPQATFNEVLQVLEKNEANAYIARQQRIDRWRGSSAPDPKPDEGKASPPEPGRQLSNADSVAGNVAPPKLDTLEDRIAAAAQALETRKLG